MITSHRLLSGCLAGFLVGASAAAAETAPAASAPPPQKETTTLQLVLFLEQHERDIEEPIPERQLARLTNNEQFYLDNLARAEVALLAGPVEGDDERVRRVAILLGESAEQAEAVLREMPSVQHGKLVFESYTWHVAKDVLHRSASTAERTSCHLGLLRRPAGASSYSEDELARLQQEHRAYVESMTASGEVVLAGPIENGLDLREALIFRAPDARRIRELVAQDPLVKAGRLKLELYRWDVPSGSF
jgi:uncharacterized protein YciI